MAELFAVAGLSALLAAYVMVAYARRNLADLKGDVRPQAAALLEKTRAESAVAKADLVAAAREAALGESRRVKARCDAENSKLEEMRDRTQVREAEVDDDIALIQERSAELDQRFASAKATRDAARKDRKRVLAERPKRLAKLAVVSGLDPDDVASALAATWLEDARTEAAHALRAIESSAQHVADAKRLLEISVGRYRNHFLTERPNSNLPLSRKTSELILADGGAISEVIQEVANIKFNVAEDGASLRLEGLDGVGREVARRAIGRLNKKPEHIAQARTNAAEWTTKIKTNLEREIMGLGRKAFAVLEIPRANPEIVDLVGRLNYRTSYTQNQWLHAVEAAFLASMIGDEMGLDRKLLRRATLMHDIGKALTHQIEGSHAVIGADIARRLGEDEVVANAIGAHHADEPPNSVYAFLVAGCDAMSGARPGARREHTEGYSSRLKDMERIGARWNGVDRAFAVHGGRELRVYVEDDQISDLDAVEMSSEIAKAISEEMVFPGQIKVTVIRSSESVSVAS